MIEFGKWLKEEIKKQNITGKYMAEDIGVTPQTLYKWTSCKGGVELENVEAALDYLGYKLQIVEKDLESKPKKTNLKDWLVKEVYKKGYNDGYNASKKDKNRNNQDT